MMDWIHHSLVKPMFAGALAYVGNSILLGESDMRRNASFAATVFGSLVIADTFSQSLLPKTDFKTLEGRVIEITGSLGAVFVLDQVMQNPTGNPMNRYGLVIASDIVADYLKDIALNSGI